MLRNAGSSTTAVGRIAVTSFAAVGSGGHVGWATRRHGTAVLYGASDRVPPLVGARCIMARRPFTSWQLFFDEELRARKAMDPKVKAAVEELQNSAPGKLMRFVSWSIDAFFDKLDNGLYRIRRLGATDMATAEQWTPDFFNAYAPTDMNTPLLTRILLGLRDIWVASPPEWVEAHPRTSEPVRSRWRSRSNALRTTATNRPNIDWIVPSRASRLQRWKTGMHAVMIRRVREALAASPASFLLFGWGSTHSALKFTKSQSPRWRFTTALDRLEMEFLPKFFDCANHQTDWQCRKWLREHASESVLAVLGGARDAPKETFGSNCRGYQQFLTLKKLEWKGAHFPKALRRQLQGAEAADNETESKLKLPTLLFQLTLRHSNFASTVDHQLVSGSPSEPRELTASISVAVLPKDQSFFVRELTFLQDEAEMI